MEIPTLIRDLAIMLLTAGIITVIFKKIKQPLILGYILAGFLLSPYFPWFANIVDTGSINTWSEIGIIFLMFHLGLEFNMHKLVEVGSTAVITCMAEVIGMLAFGYVGGQILGFSSIDSIVLGAMLVMSSTTIIIKVFDEMKIKEKYTGLVFGVLVIEDIVGIFMMVILSTIAVSKNVSGGEVAAELGMMILYLVVWLLLGIYILPTIMKKTIKLMTDEMLLVVSIGLCFGMVLLANRLGFSSALGAFLSGSLLAGTVHVERIESLTRNVKDLFGAVFFISVGMMANPEMIAKYWLEIVVIVLVTLIGKIIFNTAGMLISGQDLKTSVSSGFALAQIGEFAFIIANLGYSLGLIDEFLYPIVVAVSVITTFTTPFCIKLAPKFVGLLEKILPEKILSSLNKDNSQDEMKKDSEWNAYLKRFFLRFLIFGGIMFVTAFAVSNALEPLLEKSLSPLISKIISIGIIYLVIVIFAKPFLDRKDVLYSALWLKKKIYRLPLMGLNLIKLALLLIVLVIPIEKILGVNAIWLGLAVLALTIIISRTKIFSTWYLQIETRFLQNFNERLISEEEASGRKQEWLDTRMHIISFYVDEKSSAIGKNIKELGLGEKYSLYVMKVKRGENSTLLPKPDFVIERGDKVYMIGEKKALENFYKREKIDQTKPIRNLKQFMQTDYKENEIALSTVAIRVTGRETFAGKSIMSSGFRKDYDLIIIGMQKNGFPIMMPDPNMIIDKGDILWLMGSNQNCGRIASDHVE